MAKKHVFNKNLASGGKIPLYYAVSVLFSAMYLFGHINQVRLSLTGSNLINITNLMLCVLGAAEAILPFTIILGSKRALKIDLYLIGILFLFGNLWFFKWGYSALAHPSGVSFDFAAYQKNHGYMFNHTIWASRSAETLLLNYFSAVLWFSIAKNIDTDKASTIGSMILMLIVTFILPVIFFAATRSRIISDWWIKKSVTLFLSYICILIVMILSMRKRTFWNKFICKMKQNNTKGENYEF